MTPETLGTLLAIVLSAVGYLYSNRRASRAKAEAVSTANENNAESINKLTKRNIELAEKNDELEQRLSVVETSSTARIQELEATVERHEREAADRVAQRKRENEETALKIASIEDRHCHELDEAQRKIAALEEDVKRLSEDIERITKERAAVEIDLEAEREKTRKLQLELVKAQGRITELEADVIKLKARLEAEMAARETIVLPILHGIRDILKPPAVDADAA